MENIICKNNCIIELIEKDIEQLYIPDGITGIEPFVFQDSKIKNIRLPKTLKVIGSGAFKNCKNLEKIDFPESLNLIMDHAFENSSLKEIILPSNITKIGSFAFSGIDITFENFTLPKSLSIIGTKAFNDIKVKNLFLSSNSYTIDLFKSVENFYIQENDRYFTSIDGNIYNKELNMLIRKGNNNSKILDVEELENGCFANIKTENLVIPDTVKKIKKTYTLFLDSYVKNLTIPKDLNNAHILFKNVYLENVNLNNNPELLLEDGVVFNKKKSFLYYYMPNKKEEFFRIPDKVKCIFPYAFNTCPNLKKIITKNNLYKNFNFENEDLIPSVLDLNTNCFYNTNIETIENFVPLSINIENILAHTKVNTIFLPNFSKIDIGNIFFPEKEITIYSPLAKRFEKELALHENVHIIETKNIYDYLLLQGKSFKEINKIMK